MWMKREIVATIAVSEAKKNHSKILTTTELSIQILILLSLVSFSLETLPNMPDTFSKIIEYFELFTVSVFSIEYLARIYFSKNKLKHIFSFYGIIDLLAILPFYLSLGIDLRSIRAIRIMRIFRLFKLGRYSNALNTLTTAFMQAKEELAVYMGFLSILMFISSVGIYYFENPAQPELYASIFHSLWWAIATFTTVGYGDIYPITAGGRIFTFVMLMLSLGIVAVPTGVVSSNLIKLKMQNSKKKIN